MKSIKTFAPSYSSMFILKCWLFNRCNNSFLIRLKSRDQTPPPPPNKKSPKTNKQKQNKQKFKKHKNRRPMDHNARMSTLCFIENNKTIWIYNLSLRGINKRNLCYLLIPMHEELHTFTVHKNNMFKR